MKKAIIIGASSGIGRELAISLSNMGYHLGLMARRVEKLQELKEVLLNPSWIEPIDISDQDTVVERFRQLFQSMKDVDMVIISSGTGYLNPTLDLMLEKDTIDVNVTGVTSVMNEAIRLFEANQKGHLVVISSIAALRGSAISPAYNASKAYQSNYLEGLSIRMQKQKSPILITDVRPGLVDTEMAKGEGLFWVQPVPKVTNQIIRGIIRKKRIVYVTKRWGVIAFLLKRLPFCLYKKLG